MNMCYSMGYLIEFQVINKGNWVKVSCREKLSSSVGFEPGDPSIQHSTKCIVKSTYLNLLQWKYCRVVLHHSRSFT